jgi:hypothetical protein
LEGSTLTIIVEVNGAGTLFVVKLAEIPSTGGDTRSWTCGFPAIEPETVTAKEAVCPGATLLDPGLTERFHAYTAGIPFAIRSTKNKANRVRVALICLKTNHAR